MKPGYLVLLFLIAGFTAPMNKKLRQGESNQKIMVNGRARTYVLYLPAGINSQSKPSLVIALHGNLGTGAGTEKIASFEAIAEREKFVLVYPDGIEKSWNDGRPTKANELGVDDVQFISTLIDSIVNVYKVNPKRVYVAGISNGGFMTMRLACELSAKIAAVASVAASMNQITADGCPLHAPMPVMVLQGTKDPLVPFTGGEVNSKVHGAVLSHLEVIAKWVQIDGCSPTPAVTQLPDIAADGTTVTKTVYPGGKNNTEVISYVIENGGHTWPGGWQYLPKIFIGRTTRDINGSEVIWAFFKAHAKL
jgi:polyhydroxybutyrate depolymerase